MTRLDEESIAKLLARTGPRPVPDEAMKQAIKANLKSVWQAEVALKQNTAEAQPEAPTIQPRKTRQLFAGISAIAAVLVLTVTTLFVMQTPMDNKAYGQLSQHVNQLLYKNTGSDDAWQKLPLGDLKNNVTIRSASNSYAAIALDTGIKLRLGANSEIKIASSDLITLKQGQIYVDSANTTADIAIDTPFGLARDIGTQFMVQVAANQWRVQVREGLVEVSQADPKVQIEKVSIAAGEQVLLSSGAVELNRSEVRSDDTSWRWIQHVSANYSLEASKLSDYLRWVSEETGRKIVYQSEFAESSAKRTILHGSVAGVIPSETLDLVLPTTKFTWRLNDRGDIEISH